MKKKFLKRLLIVASSVFIFLIAVLAVHIYVVTRPKAADATTRVMARIDIYQKVDSVQGDNFKRWLYKQKGVDHVLYNPASRIVVFSFSPIETNADNIVQNFKTTFKIQAERYIPSAKDIQSGCPVAATSTSYKVVHFLSNLF